MDSLFFSFTLDSSPLVLNQNERFESDYQTVYKPLIKFLYNNPSLKFSFSFNGPQLQFLRKKHPEFITLLEELVVTKQVEVLGGGFYDPLFPLLFPMDRSGQIDMLSLEIRNAIGKRPRGLSICGSSWDSSLVTSFYTCGLEYVLLDESLIPVDKFNYVPFFMSDKGKSIDIIPFCNSLKPNFTESVSEYIKKIKEKVLSTKKNCKIQIEAFPCICIKFNHEELKKLLDSSWINELVSYCIQKEYEFTTPFLYKKNTFDRIPIFISSGISKEISQWALKPYCAKKTEQNYNLTIYDFLQLYSQSRALYNRMLYVSLLLNQCHGDKVRKRNAREKLWQAQNGHSFICTSKGAFVNSFYRQKSYKSLIEAEKILRECGNFTESLTSYDYDGDGIKEYVCRMEKYFATISLKSGCINELDIMNNSGNFADNLSRISDFDGCDDDYQRGLFIDHIFSENEFNNYLENKPISSGIFSKKRYSEIKVSEKHREILLYAESLYKNKQKISLKKRYVINSSGMMVQYILKNDSDIQLKAVFVVESNFAQINFNNKDFNAFSLAIITDNQKKELDTKVSSKELNSSGKLDNVEGFQLTDIDNSTSFTFEPNESCGLCFVPVVFKRPEFYTSELVDASMTFSSSMFWNVNLEPGMEMEKTINFGIFSQHKKRKKSQI